MPTTKSAWIWLDLSPYTTAADVSTVTVKGVPVAGTIKSIQLGVNAVLTTGGGIVAVAKGSVNVLSSTTYNLGAAATPDLVAATPEFATLTTAKTSLKVAAGDLLKATWTLTTFAATTNAITLLIGIEPDSW